MSRACTCPCPCTGFHQRPTLFHVFPLHGQLIFLFGYKDSVSLMKLGQTTPNVSQVPTAYFLVSRPNYMSPPGHHLHHHLERRVKKQTHYHRLSTYSPMAVLLLTSLVLLFLSSSTLGSSLTLLNAAQMLSNSGYRSMSLTLLLISKTLHLKSHTATIFAPSDSAFIRSGQPSLALFQYHVLPRRLSLETLKTLPRGTRIPTLISNESLIVTASPASSDGYISVNHVRIDEKAMFDDGSVIMYGIDEFFNSSFKLIPEPAYPKTSRGSTIGDRDSIMAHEPQVCGVQSFGSVANFLRSTDYSIMAAFLDAQLMGFNAQTGLTIFAPADEAIDEKPRNISNYSLVFRQHIVPRLLPWKDLLGIDGGTMLQTFSEGFVINVTFSDDVPLLNGAPIVYQDMFQRDWLVVHGLNGLLTSPAKQDSIEDSSFSDGYIDPDIHDYGA